MSEQAINLEKDIRELVAQILEVEPQDIKPDAHFVKDLGMDSMMALEILASLEKKYRIVVPEETLTKFINLQSTIQVISDILKKSKK